MIVSSPLPWVVDDSLGFRIRSAGRVIADINGPDEFQRTDEANASLIVRAVNSRLTDTEIALAVACIRSTLASLSVCPPAMQFRAQSEALESLIAKLEGSRCIDLAGKLAVTDNDNQKLRDETLREWDSFEFNGFRLTEKASEVEISMTFSDYQKMKAAKVKTREILSWIDSLDPKLEVTQ
jgi:hypothetical protein